jgi:non-canonical poly(A) RNA polymerase PAPD5/7
MLKLHFEIVDFYNYIKPHKSEYDIRKKSFEILKQILLKKFPDFRVKSFGSFPNEIFLADSDVDIVVISKQKIDQKKTLEKIYECIIGKSELFDYIRKIDAKVPIIKLQLKETKIFLDISVDRKNGYDAKRVIKRSMNDFHALKPLLYVLKYFIRQKKLNETFTGGVSSFLLFNLVLAFLQYKNKIAYSNINNYNSNQLNLGQLLVDFFQFYGFEFNYDEIGISVRYGGFFYKKKDKE